MNEAEIVQARVPDGLIGMDERPEGAVLDVAPEHLPAVARILRDDPHLKFEYPADLCGYETPDGFVLWYRLVSIERATTLFLTVRLPKESPRVPSLVEVWPGLDWHERETFDLYGVEFVGHPDARDPARMRILLPEDWVGHPFRSDYEPVFTGNPLSGPQERN
jgi:NADH-quinone oxidoreductase subunit C